MGMLSQCYDVAVLGAGPGGVAAALAAARQGAKVILADRNGHVGGNLVMGLPLLGFLDQNGTQIIGGIAQELVETLMQSGHSFGHVRCPMHNSITLVHPEMLKLLLFKLIKAEGIDLLLHAEVTEAHVQNKRLERVTLTGKGTQVSLKAKVFADATGDGDLAALCGASYEKGQNNCGIVQPPTVMFSLTGFEEEAFFRFLDENPENMRQLSTVEIDEGYDTALWRSTPSHVFVGLQAYLDKLAKEQNIPILRENIIYINSTIPGKIFVNTVRVPGCDGSDLQSLTEGEIQGHLQIPQIIDMLREHVPGFEHVVLDAISPAIGIRESRRFLGLTTLTGTQVLRGERPFDTIALGGYKMDIHNGRGKGTILKKVTRPYGIPLRATISREIDGLMYSGRCISMDSEALGSVRVMPTLMAIGEGVGICAALSAAQNVSPAAVDPELVRDRLQERGAILKI